jgi:hypothetical protein
MSALLRASILTAVGLCYIVQARADDQTVPADTATFVSYCTDANFERCRSKVMDVDNFNLMNQLSGTHGCTFPHSPDRSARVAERIAATKAILVWLKTNPTKRLPKTYDAIDQAIATLWPSECRN